MEGSPTRNSIRVTHWNRFPWLRHPGQKDQSCCWSFPTWSGVDRFGIFRSLASCLVSVAWRSIPKKEVRWWLSRKGHGGLKMVPVGYTRMGLFRSCPWTKSTRDSPEAAIASIPSGSRKGHFGRSRLRCCSSSTHKGCAEGICRVCREQMPCIWNQKATIERQRRNPIDKQDEGVTLQLHFVAPRVRLVYDSAAEPGWYFLVEWTSEYGTVCRTHGCHRCNRIASSSPSKTGPDGREGHDPPRPETPDGWVPPIEAR